MSVLKLEGITKTYEVQPPLDVLRGVNLSVEASERVAILGDSGAGKSTLLNILGLLDVPSSGNYFLDGDEVSRLSARERDRLRAEDLGFVFQDFHVLGHRTVSQNLDIKLAINNASRSERPSIISGVLDTVGLSDRRDSLGRLLSGGEKQRLAIARAIMMKPRILLADEPTGNLDERNARAVLDLFTKQAGEGTGVVVITHDPRLTDWADTVYRLEGGRLR